ncbi:hypothetical protein BGP_5104 [Beggiatoa sp. PS]|nr:hypothetical protein BGP_5104 [Beggiatoa sp. PS]
MAKTKSSYCCDSSDRIGFTQCRALFLLYYFEEPILDWSKRGGWYFLVPISMAFFSIVHGTFTGRFWDLLGVKAKSVKK